MARTGQGGHEPRLQLGLAEQITPFDADELPAVLHQGLLPTAFLEEDLRGRCVLEVLCLSIKLKGQQEVAPGEVEPVLAEPGLYGNLLVRQGQPHPAHEVPGQGFSRGLRQGTGVRGDVPGVGDSFVAGQATSNLLHPVLVSAEPQCVIGDDQ